MSETLGWFDRHERRQRACSIGHPRGEDAQSLVGSDERRWATKARRRMSAARWPSDAFANPDFEFILIAMRSIMPPVQELVQWLRRDYRTARHADRRDGSRRESASRCATRLQDDPFTTVFPRIFSIEVAAKEIAKLQAIAGRNLVGRDERTAQAEAALAALTILAKDPATFRRLRVAAARADADRRAEQSVAIGRRGRACWRLLGTPKAQTALVDFASQQQPSARRSAGCGRRLCRRGEVARPAAHASPNRRSSTPATTPARRWTPTRRQCWARSSTRSKRRRLREEISRDQVAMTIEARLSLIVTRITTESFVTSDHCTCMISSPAAQHLSNC